jgi:hypothetical protein
LNRRIRKLRGREKTKKMKNKGLKLKWSRVSKSMKRNLKKWKRSIR